MKYVSGVLFSGERSASTAAGAGTGSGSSEASVDIDAGKGREEDRHAHFGKKLPRAWGVMRDQLDPDVLRGCRRVVVIGIHGWFPGMCLSCASWEYEAK